MRPALLLAFTLAAATTHAQFTLQTSNTTASLRGIDAVSPEIAWASGTNGTVLHTEDGGTIWKPCPVPKGAEKLDFRGVQAFDAATAVVMASGKGSASKVYRTTDTCQTWKLVFDNPDPKGFFDDLRRVSSKQMYLLGDVVKGKFALFFSPDQGLNWFISDDPGLEADPGDGAFAASSSGLIALGTTIFFGTGGAAQAHVYATAPQCVSGATGQCPVAWVKLDTPLAAAHPGAGVFSIAGCTNASMSGKLTSTLVAVGGDYEKPTDATGTAATSTNGGHSWVLATTPPAGYRSAVVFDVKSQTWITVGSSGSEISRDNGRTWAPIVGDNVANWNALSLPFVVGPKGRIGRLTVSTK